ncbi:Transposase IS200 like protein [Lignipirellula cremea]|uniref:Transposase IS200 like protein n=1 Tax=Lignipirellula cremea TaxID=2528010 RepID=A0A518DSR1_9BACT|nr:Transposase IS200 like protein [Lignipirellula cremea]
MNYDDPLAYFITWTVYGTHLQGDSDGWRRRSRGQQNPQPRLQRWRAERLKHEIVLLSPADRTAVTESCHQHCRRRDWKLWEINVRSNHLHLVVTATGYAGTTVRDQLKANATRAVREHAALFRDRPVWTSGGDWRCVNTDADLDAVCLYVREAQDRKEFDVE